MLYALSRWWRDRQRLRQRSSLVCPRCTGRTTLMLAACALMVWGLVIVWVWATS